MSKIYIAAAYSRRDEMVGIADQLIAAGHTITSRWIYGDHEVPPDGIAVDSPEHFAWAAQDDYWHLNDASVIVSVTGGGNRSKGGRHVEFGIGLSNQKRLIILGDRENVFHFLPWVEHYDSLDDVIAALTGPGLARAA